MPRRSRSSSTPTRAASRSARTSRRRTAKPLTKGLAESACGSSLNRALLGSSFASAAKLLLTIAPSTDGSAAADIAATFALIAHVLLKRTLEGREATALVRRGMNQNEAAEALGISKQAMSQRLQAAGWPAEQAGWQLALNLITRAAAQTG